ncbi:MAG: hypothetical protein HOW73_08335 [Polyangiaceae bacterium]|nr:hypothetical protein [Polyangiaceae bacterium]
MAIVKKPLNPYAPPASDDAPPKRAKSAASSARFVGTSLSLKTGDKLPPVCLKCSATPDVEYVPKTFYVPPPGQAPLTRTPLGGIIGLLAVLAIDILRTQDARTIECAIPFCSPCRHRWELRRKLATGCVWATLVTLPVAILLVVNGVGPVPALVWVGLLLAAVVTKLEADLAGVDADRVHDSFVLLNGVDTRARAALERLAPPPPDVDDDDELEDEDEDEEAISRRRRRRRR